MDQEFDATCLSNRMHRLTLHVSLIGCGGRSLKECDRLLRGSHGTNIFLIGERGGMEKQRA